MAIVTQEYRNPSQDKIQRNFKYFLQLCIVTIVLYAPEILNANIEQGYQNMPSPRTPQEKEFLEYFRSIEKRAIQETLAQYRSTGPIGYSTSLVMARILKVKERISSDRELSECPSINSPSPGGRGLGGGGMHQQPKGIPFLFHPHPNPPPSRGREFGIFMDGH